MAFAIRLVRIEPDAPTIMPATISAVLSSASPMAAADKPVAAFSSEITTGMSAPPIGSTTSSPSTDDVTSRPTISHSDAPPTTIATPNPTAASSTSRFSGCCSRPTVIGRPGRISCSFPNATLEPQNDADPTIAANSDATATYAASWSNPALLRNSTHAINAIAPPPTPLNSATICGIAVIFTRRAAGTPTAVPIATPSRISHQLPSPGVSSVATTATAMPAAAIMLPRTAVFGPVSPISP